jgi:hypothetical protein
MSQRAIHSDIQRNNRLIELNMQIGFERKLKK